MCLPAGTLLADGSDVADLPSEVICPSGIVAARPFAHQWHGDLIVIELQGGLTVRATPQQMFLAYHRHTRYRRISPEPKWIRSEDLEADNHYLIVPSLHGAFDDLVIDAASFIGGGKRRGRYQTPLRGGFLLDEATSWLLGLYVAEGSGSSSDGTGYAQLALSLAETALAHRAMAVAKRLGYDARLYRGERGLQVYLGGPVLEKALKSWCGSRARSKHVPVFILIHRDLPILKAFLDGLMTGDGSTRRNSPKHKGYVRLHTASRALDRQVRLVLARLGLGHHGHILRQPVRTIRGKTLREGILYRVDWTWTPRKSVRTMQGRQVETVHHRWKAVSEGIALPIRGISREPFDGLVCNMGTGDHPYIAEALITRDDDCHARDPVRNTKVAGLPSIRDYDRP